MTDDTLPHLFFSRPLPLELLPRVAVHLANTSQPVSQLTLARIARCSRHTYRFAQPLLYSTFYLDDDTSTYLLDNFIHLDELYDGGDTFPSYLFDTFTELNPVNLPSHLRILHNLWSIRTLVIKSTPYGQGVGLLKQFAERVQQDGVVLLPKLKRIVVARSALERIARAEAIHKRISSSLFAALLVAAEPTSICVDIHPEPPFDFRMDEDSIRRGRPFFADRSFEEYFASLDPEKIKELTTHLHGTGVKPVIRSGMRNVLSFADDTPNPAEFMLEEDELLGNLLVQSDIGHIVDQIKHAITSALIVRSRRPLGPGWTPRAPPSAPPDDNAPLSPAAQARFRRLHPGAVDSDASLASSSSLLPVAGAVSGVPVLPSGTLIAPHTATATDTSDMLKGTTFVFVLPGWMVLQPIEEAIRDWAGDKYGGTDEQTAAVQKSIEFQSRGSGEGSQYCEACGQAL